jgi:hypothetical protein
MSESMIEEERSKVGEDLAKAGYIIRFDRFRTHKPYTAIGPAGRIGDYATESDALAAAIKRFDEVTNMKAMMSQTQICIWLHYVQFCDRFSYMCLAWNEHMPTADLKYDDSTVLEIVTW